MDDIYIFGGDTLKGENSSKINKPGVELDLGYVENIGKIVAMTIKTMNQEDGKRDDRSKDINDEEMKRIMNIIKK